MSISTFRPDLMAIAAMTLCCARNATGNVLKRQLRTQFLGTDEPKIS